MELAYQFDFVQDTQKVFRQLLNAFSNPARIYSIEEQASKFEGEFASLTAIGCTLLDTEVSMYIEKSTELQSQLASLTLSCASDVEHADYLFITEECNYSSVEDMLSLSKKGSYADPHVSATFIFRCGSIDGEAALTAAGPGIQGELTVHTTQYIRNLIALRQKMSIEYPCGIDMLFVTENGQIMAMPRLCSIK